MKISLNTQMQRFVDEKVKSGQYATPDEVVNSALAVLRAQETESAEDSAELRRLIAVGIAQLDRGEGSEWDPDDLKRRVRDAASGAREKRAG
jgi:antitoxin ParD1/3/4